MNQADIDNVRKGIENLRRRLGNIRPGEIMTLAKALGRTQRAGSSPAIYVSPLPGRRSLPIHYHPRAMKRGTAKGSLDVLEADLDAWEMYLAEPKSEASDE